MFDSRDEDQLNNWTGESHQVEADKKNKQETHGGRKRWCETRQEVGSTN